MQESNKFAEIDANIVHDKVNILDQWEKEEIFNKWLKLMDIHFLFVCFEMGSCYIAQAECNLEIGIKNLFYADDCA